MSINSPALGIVMALIDCKPAACYGMHNDGCYACAHGLRTCLSLMPRHAGRLARPWQPSRASIFMPSYMSAQSIDGMTNSLWQWREVEMHEPAFVSVGTAVHRRLQANDRGASLASAIRDAKEPTVSVITEQGFGGPRIAKLNLDLRWPVRCPPTFKIGCPLCDRPVRVDRTTPQRAVLAPARQLSCAKLASHSKSAGRSSCSRGGRTVAVS